jgi:hypothetical protein
MAMNSEQDASPDLPDAEGTDANADADTDLDSGIDPDIGTESLQRSRDAIDQGREAAREALKDDADWTAGTPEEPPGAEEPTDAG